MTGAATTWPEAVEAVGIAWAWAAAGVAFFMWLRGWK